MIKQRAGLLFYSWIGFTYVCAQHVAMQYFVYVNTEIT